MDKNKLKNETQLKTETSMETLIYWNVSKALEKKPSLDLRSAIKTTQMRLEEEGQNLNTIISQYPEERHLTCALLAWQQLGHSNADSLFKFVESKIKENEHRASNLLKDKKLGEECSAKMREFISSRESVYSKGGTNNFSSFGNVGPVVKLPLEQKIVLRLDSTQMNSKQPHKTPRSPEKDIMNKIDAACCMESGCVERLGTLEKSTNELRTRACRLARREAERAELLERAEAAWRDLELGYQRRINLADEKEEDLAKQIKKLIEERNSYKQVSVSITKELQEKSAIAEKEKNVLIAIEKEVCDRACVRLRLSEESARGDSLLADSLCKAAQLDRDLQFKEEQTRRKVITMQNNVDTSHTLTHEAERAMRSELCALKEQMQQASQDLLKEDAFNGKIQKQLEELRTEKMEIIEDLDGCKLMCDDNMKGIMDELKKKQNELADLKMKVIECKCRMPVDADVQVKRTPSIVALCSCAPEDRFLESCSCTSLRSKLLSDLLADLFGGLQSEMGTSAADMPCQLLKCLEDKHNWDRGGHVKTHLRSYFSKLLVGELDIAIATSIEKYHAKWVGTSCADVRMIPDPGDVDPGWQERLIEDKAQKLASQLAEQLFKDRADQLTEKAKDVLKKGPPPCSCQPPDKGPAVFTCLVPQRKSASHTSRSETSSYWKKTLQDVARLRQEIEDIKKDSIKKEDLKQMEDNLSKIVQRVTETEAEENYSYNNNLEIDMSLESKNNIQEDVLLKYGKVKPKAKSNMNKTKPSKNIQSQNCKTSSKQNGKNTGHSYAVNLCLCSEQKKLDKSKSKKVSNNILQNENFESIWTSKSQNNIVKAESKTNILKSFVQQANDSPSLESKFHNKPSSDCRSSCVCFHKAPSSSSIDRLLETLAKWKRDLKNVSKKKYTENNFNTASYQQAKEYQMDANNLFLQTESKKSKCVIVNCSTNFGKNDNDLKNEITENKINQAKPVSVTESEYIRAIDLEKSYENINLKNLNVDKKTELNKPTIHKNQSMLISDAILNSNKTQVVFEGRNNDKIDIENSEINNKYNIQFLGAILANVNKEKNLSNNNLKSYNQRQKVENNIDNLQNKNNADSNLKVENCQCHFTIDDFKSFVNNITCNKHQNQLTENKALDTKSLNTKSSKSKESCVCCHNKNVEDNFNLKINAFSLLENHLKEKFNAFNSSCKSDCITEKDKEVLFSTVLEKIKHVMSEFTNKFSCQCSFNENNEESWKRAFSLLQEYLKLKIKRVQCLCTNDENLDKHIPDTLEVITNLIDKDFIRLREICKCSKDKKQEEKSSAEDLYLQDLPERERTDITINNFQDFAIMCTKDSIRDNFKISVDKSSLFIPQDISSQTSALKDMASISCEVISRKEKAIHANTLKSTFDCGCCYSNMCIDMEHKKEIMINHCTDIKSNLFSESIEKKKSNADSELAMVNGKENKCNDFIGYTIDCSCDKRLGSCRCMKSTVDKNNVYISKLWDQAVAKANCVLNTSNILNTIYTAKKNNMATIDFKKLSEPCLLNTHETCTNIKIKPSISKYEKISNTTNTNDDFFTDYLSQDEWGECSSELLDFGNTSVKPNKNLYYPLDDIKKQILEPVLSCVGETAKHDCCKCKTVPMCHVKMLIENIEDNLTNSACTCDALQSKFCPLHS